MNIFVPHDWLLDHLETEVGPEEMQKLLSLSGPSVERIHTKNDKPVYEIEITSNRIDMASVRGIAREAAVILQQQGISAQLKPLPSTLAWNVITPESLDTTTFPVKIEDSQNLCSQVLGVLFTVKNGESPDWMVERLAASDISSHGILVDITNYLMLELGQPCHIFDADRVGSTMQIRLSKEGEEFVGLDEVTYTLPGDDIVVDNGSGVITDLIGVKGALNSGIVDGTTRVLFFVERPDPKKARRTSLLTGIRTEAAQLNENNLDPELPMICLSQAMRLLRDHADGELISDVFDLHNSIAELKAAKPEPIRYHLNTTQRYLGISPDLGRHTSILEALGCVVEVESDDVILISPPSYRPDMQIAADVVEEIARIIGYHNIEGKMLDTIIPVNKQSNQQFQLERDLTHFLANIGWQELLSYSHVSEPLVKMSDHPLDEHFRLKDPLTVEHQFMRRELWPSLVEYLQKHKRQAHRSVFELGMAYHPTSNENLSAEHELRLSLASTKPYAEVLADLSRLFSRVYVEQPDWGVGQTEQFSREGVEIQAGNILIHEERVGVVRHLDGIIVIEIIWNELIKHVRKYPTYQPILGYQPVIEDITIGVKEEESVWQILHQLYQLPDVRTVHLIDQYQTNYTFRIWFFSRERQLTTQDVQSAISSFAQSRE